MKTFILIIAFFIIFISGQICCAQNSRPVYQEKDISQSKLNSIRQGQIGDCWFEASLAAVLNLPKGQQVLKRMIENGAPGTYQVHFNDNGFVYEITQDDINSLPLGKKEALWAKIIETAMHKRFFGLYNNNHYFQTDDGWGQGLVALTGNPIEKIKLSEIAEPELINYLQYNFQMQNPMICATKSNVSNTYLVANHVYTILGFDMGTYKVKLRNPWGRNPNGVKFGFSSYGVDCPKNNQGFIEIPFDDFRNDFTAIIKSQLN